MTASPRHVPQVICILRQSTVYSPDRVEWLRRQITDAHLVTIGDNRGATIPLLFGWPGWWSKLEICRPDIPGDLFYMDLDTVVRGPVQNFALAGRTTFLSDFYRPAQLQSSVMYLTAADRARIWNAWMKDPAGHISRLSVKRPGFNGDQNFMEEVLGQDVARWQDTPGTTPVCSYKVDCIGQGRAIPDSGLVVFHGKPRPWDVAGAPWNK